MGVGALRFNVPCGAAWASDLDNVANKKKIVLSKVVISAIFTWRISIFVRSWTLIHASLWHEGWKDSSLKKYTLHKVSSFYRKLTWIMNIPHLFRCCDWANHLSSRCRGGCCSCWYWCWSRGFSSWCSSLKKNNFFSKLSLKISQLFWWKNCQVLDHVSCIAVACRVKLLIIEKS